MKPQPSLSLNKQKLDNLASEIWKSATRLRGKFKAYEYQNVILPIIVIRRLECVLLKWREDKKAEIRAKKPKLTEKELDALVKKLELNPQQAPFSNKTKWTLRKVYEEDHTLLAENFRDYINGFSKNVDEIIEHFNYRAVIGEMVKRNRLAPILNQYKEEPLGPDNLSNLEMGYVYEELLRRFSEEAGEEAGDHFTPREVIRLMVELLEIPIPEKHLSIYDPACGTGGMLSVAQEHLFDRAKTDGEKRRVEQLVTVHGQELSPPNYAVCKADLVIKDDRQAKIFLGNSLIPHDPHSREPGDQLPETKYRFDYMLSNPPFGVTWGGKDGYDAEVRKLATTRYKAGIPRVDNGALLFLQTMLAKMKEVEKGSSRIAIIFNGSALSNGDCGSGESEIRRWILENDWLDAIVMLPDQMFYNTGIFTYIWLLRNEKPSSHRGRVMIIDARKQFEKEPKAFSNKRNRMTDAHRQWIEQRYRDGWKANYSDEGVKTFQNNGKQKDFAYHKVSVVFWQTDENDQPAIINEKYEKTFSAANIAKEQAFYDSELEFKLTLTDPEGGCLAIVAFTLAPEDSFPKIYERLVRQAFPSEVEAKTRKLTDATAKKKAVKRFIDSLQAEVEWTHRHYVKDDEYIPYGQNIDAFLEREIAKPIIRWEQSPQLGYEILPNKYFYRYQPPTPAKDLLSEFWRLEKEAEKMLEGLGTA
ncbi:MAG: type I restriction-modification system subunit M [Pyrinomonadaceae bacterium]